MKTAKARRMVEYAGRQPGKGEGRGPRLWAYGYAELASLLGASEGALRVRVRRGLLAPGDLEAVCKAWATARGIALAVILAVAGAGCGEITAQDSLDAGGVGGAAVEMGTGGRALAGTGGTHGGTGGHVAVGVGGAPSLGTGGTAQAYPFCEPTETLSVDSAICQKLDPGGTYSNRTKDGHVCALCDPYPNPPVTNLPCIYTSRLCVQDCSLCN